MQDKFITMSNEEYHAHYALGSSDVRKLMISPLHFEGREEPAVRPAYFPFGSAAHTGYLEPDKFEDEYRVKPQEVDGKGSRTSYYKEWMATQPPCEWMSPEDYDKVLKVIDSARRHPITDELYKGEVITEGSLFFDLEGVPCKARPDLVSVTSDGVDVLDLKTTMDASPAGFAKSVGNLGYHVQEWFYRQALNACGIKVNRFLFLAVEKTAPYASAVYTIKEDDVTACEALAKGAVKKYKEALDSDVWEGYTEAVTEIGVPRWALPTSIPNGNWISVREARNEFEVSRTTIYNWIAKGVESRMFGGRRMLSAKGIAALLR